MYDTINYDPRHCLPLCLGFSWASPGHLVWEEQARRERPGRVYMSLGFFELLLLCLRASKVVTNMDGLKVPVENCNLWRVAFENKPANHLGGLKLQF